MHVINAILAQIILGKMEISADTFTAAILECVKNRYELKLDIQKVPKSRKIDVLSFSSKQKDSSELVK